MRFRYVLAVVLLVCAPLSLQAQSSTCTLGTATADLHANDVRAGLFNTGGLFWKGRGPVYNVPAVADGEPITPNAIFAAGLWMGGKVNGQVRVAAADYSRWELWPGPLDAAGNPPADCAPYDRIFTIGRADVLAYERSGIVSPALRDWPWRWGAPVVDGDGDPANYNLAGGDRPEVLGHEMHWWVMNDAAGIHAETGSAPLRMQVQVSAYAVASPIPALHQTTFYRYTFIYKGQHLLEDAYVGLWMDPDLGNATDDYVGADTALSMGFVYNADNNDEGSDGYGTAPPALGVVYLQGLNASGRPLAVANGYPKVGTQRTGDAFGPAEIWYNYLRGVWKDGSPIYTCGDGAYFDGLACAATAQPTTYTHTGDPVIGAFWSELNFDGAGYRNPPNDRRLITSTGPATLQPGETKEVTFAIVWARGADHLDSVTRLRAAASDVRSVWQVDPALRNAPLPAAPARAPLALRTTVTARDSTYALEVGWQPLADGYRYEIDAEIAGFDTLVTTRAAQRTVDLSAAVAAGRVLPGSVGRWRVRATTLGGAGPWTDWQRLELGTAAERLNEDRFHVAVLGAQPVASVLRVRYAVGIARQVRLALYDALGRRVAVLHEGAVFAGGPYAAEADVSGLAAGVYLVRLESQGPAVQTEAVRVVIAR